MKQLPISLGALALACASPSYAQSSEVLTGLPGLACEAVLCLSSSLRPGECAASVSHYFDIRKYYKGMLDWEATVDARRFFLGMCPVSAEPGMSARMDAISRGAGKCDPDYLNAAYGKDIYRYRVVGSHIEAQTETSVQGRFVSSGFSHHSTSPTQLFSSAS